MPLSSLGIKAALGKAKPYKLVDGDGLYLVVTPTNSKLWRLDYRYGGKRKTLSMGAFPAIKLADARDQREAARRKLKAGEDPALGKGALEARPDSQPRETFADLAKRWFKARQRRWTAAYAMRIWNRIAGDIIPVLGDKAPQDVTSDDVLRALRRIEARGAVETARRIRGYVEDIFKFAKAEKLVQANPADDLLDALATPAPPKRRKALKAKDLPGFLETLSNFRGDIQTRLALRLVMLTFVRTSELRFAQWDEFEDLGGKEPLWRIPGARMKMRNEHIVPLAPQAVSTLKELRKLAGDSEFVFPAPTVAGVMSENTMIYALYRMGYHSRATVHGFRGTASTILNEKGFNRDWIERQLAHVELNEVRSAYNAAQWLPQRRKMMSWWANYLDGQRPS